MRVLFLLVFFMAVAAGGVSAYNQFSNTKSTVNFRTAQIDRGDLIVSVSATGTLEPEDLVDVGAQVVGRVDALGIDARGTVDPRYAGKQVDYGALVEEGQTLAIIDEAIYLAQRNQAKAALEHSRASLLQLEATLRQTEAEWLRAQKLRSLKLTGLAPASLKSSRQEPIEIIGISDADYVLAQANYDSAKASIDIGKASIAQNEALLQLAETNLGYTVIRSPVSGTIIDRRVNIGQTVVSSLNAPSLFLIAKDLRRMQIWASVNEADIGLIKVDMPVKFTVDAFPEDVFEGQVVQIRLNATMTQNVVTYTVVIENDNSDLKLLPYLTADVKFLIRRIPDVLLVPNAALRYQPPANRISPDVVAATPVPSQGADSEVEALGESRKSGTVWVRHGNFVVPVPVLVGETDNSLTAIYSDQLSEGNEIVLGETQVAATQETNNPFGPPKIPRKTPSTEGDKK